MHVRDLELYPIVPLFLFRLTLSEFCNNIWLHLVPAWNDFTTPLSTKLPQHNTFPPSVWLHGNLSLRINDLVEDPLTKLDHRNLLGGWPILTDCRPKRLPGSANTHFIKGNICNVMLSYNTIRRFLKNKSRLRNVSDYIFCSFKIRNGWN